MNNQIYTPKQDYKVLTFCATYNQSKYIEDALNGFAMQKTNFPFVCLVMDDCSTDEEQEVIKTWMERECDMTKAEFVDLEASHVILVPHKTNVNCTFAVYLLKRNLCGKPLKQEMIAPWREHAEYEALCEGDDYWIADDKLQRQVEFMDSNHNIALSFSDVCDIVENNDKEASSHIKGYDNVNLPSDKRELFYYIMNGNVRIQTLTVMYRLSLFSLIPANNRTFMMGDTPLWLDLSQLGSFHYIPEVMGCYRIHVGSACRNPLTSKKFRLSMFEMRMFYCSKYGYDVPTKILREYNRSAVDLLIDNDISISKLPYPLYSMNTVQTIILKLAKNVSLFKYLIRLMWKIEYVFTQ